LAVAFGVKVNRNAAGPKAQAPMVDGSGTPDANRERSKPRIEDRAPHGLSDLFEQSWLAGKAGRPFNPPGRSIGQWDRADNGVCSKELDQLSTLLTPGQMSFRSEGRPSGRPD